MARSVHLVLLLWIGCAALLPAAAAQDELILKNGDRLTGTVVSLADGKLVFKTEAAGTVTLAWSQIRTIRSTEALKLVLADGTVFSRPLQAVEGEGLQPGGEGPRLPLLALTEVSLINPPPVEIDWSGDLAVSAAKTTGNSETTAVSATLDAVRRSTIDRFTFGAGWFYSEQENLTTGDKELTERKVFAGLKYDYFITKRWYANANTKAEGSRASDLELRYTLGGGLGYQFVEEKDLKISAEAGVGYFYEKFRRLDADQFLSGRVAGTLDWNLNDRVSFGQKVEWYPGLEDGNDHLVHTDSRLRAALTEAMFAQFQVIMDWDNTPAPGLERRDLKFILGVGWKF